MFCRRLVLTITSKVPKYHGTPDSEKTFTQTVSYDSKALSAINENEETPFKVSLEMKTAAAPIKVRRLNIT